MFKIVLDPGHGGTDRKNVGPTGYVEADGVLAISKYLRDELLKTGAFEVRMTRIVDATLGLTERGKIGATADLFISEHTNAAGIVPNKTVRGTEIFYSVDIPEDKDFAAKLSAAVSTAIGVPNHGAKIRESEKYPGEDYYTVIDTAQDNGAKHVFIIESAFHDNAQDEAILKIDANLKKIAEAQAKVICEFFKVTATKPTTPATPTASVTNPILKRVSIDTGKEELKFGSKSDQVKLLQKELGLAGYSCGSVDGSFGTNTDKAVKAFQKVHSLTPDGVVGPKTWDALLGVDVVVLDPKSLKAKTVNNKSSNLLTTIKGFVNANFFNMTNPPSTIGWLMSGGTILNRRDEYKTWKGNPKGTFMILKDGTVDAKQMYDKDIVAILDKISFCCQGFDLFPAGDLKAGIASEGFEYGKVAYRSNRVAIGWNGKNILIVVQKESDAIRMQHTMEMLGCKGNAICLDSGDSTNLAFGGKMVYSTTRTLANILYW